MKMFEFILDVLLFNNIKILKGLENRNRKNTFIFPTSMLGSPRNSRKECNIQCDPIEDQINSKYGTV